MPWGGRAHTYGQVGCSRLLVLPVVEVQVKDVLHLPVGQEQLVGAKEDTVSPVDAAQPDRELGSFQHAANLGAEWSAGIQHCQCCSGVLVLLCQVQGASWPFVLIESVRWSRVAGSEPLQPWPGVLGQQPRGAVALGGSTPGPGCLCQDGVRAGGWMDVGAQPSLPACR